MYTSIGSNWVNDPIHPALLGISCSCVPLINARSSGSTWDYGSCVPLINAHSRGSTWDFVLVRTVNKRPFIRPYLGLWLVRPVKSGSTCPLVRTMNGYDFRALLAPSCVR